LLTLIGSEKDLGADCRNESWHSSVEDLAGVTACIGKRQRTRARAAFNSSPGETESHHPEGREPVIDS
jgi:hypothetical protein